MLITVTPRRAVGARLSRLLAVALTQTPTASSPACSPKCSEGDAQTSPTPRRLVRATARLLAATLAAAALYAPTSPAAAAQLTEPVEVTVTIHRLEMLTATAVLAQPTVRFGFNPVLTGQLAVPDVGSGGRTFTPTNWEFKHVIVPQPTTLEGFYPLRIEGVGFFSGPLGLVVPASLDIDPHACSGGFFDGCADIGIDRPAPDDRALDLTLSLNERKWFGPGESTDGNSNIFGAAGEAGCVEGTFGDSRAAKICFTISWQLPPPTLTVTKEQDDNGVCDPTDCSLREALLAVPDGGATIVLPHEDYELTIPRDPSSPPGKSGHLAITQSNVMITGTGDPGGTVIRQFVPDTRVLEVHVGVTAEVRNLSIVGGASRETIKGTAFPSHVHGGGIHNHGILSMTNVTVSGNTATSSSTTSEGRGGGGIYNADIMTLTNVTIADNESPVLGSGLSGSSVSVTTLENTLIVNNGGGGTNCTRGLNIVDNGGSLQYPGDSCSALPTASQNPVAAVDAVTVTYPLPAGSPAVDAAIAQDCPETDELGTSRPQLGAATGQARCDIGAIERLNRAPVATIATAAGGYITSEGTGIQLSGRGTDADGDSLTYRWSPPGDLNDATAASPIFTAADEGQFPLTLTVDDGQATSPPASTSVTVSNVAPTVNMTGSAPANPIRLGVPASVTANVTDPGVADAVTCTLDWDDGTGPQPATVAGSAATRSCSASHTFAAAGTYTVTMQADDGDGGSGSASTLLVVYDSSAGPLAAGGQIDSPAGALRSAPASAGRASFAAAAAYATATSTTPTGTVTWRLTAPNFQFASTSLSWLVASGARFQIGGTGQIDGTGSYRFLLTGIDGQRLPGEVDRVRLRVWDPSAGGAVVYDSTVDPAATDDIDNARPSPLRTGNITIP